MTNITLSIDDEVYGKMKKYSEMKWSEFVRKIIKKRLDELERLEKIPEKERLSLIFENVFLILNFLSKIHFLPFL